MVPSWPDLAFARPALTIRPIFDRPNIGEHIQIVLHVAVYFLSNGDEGCNCLDRTSSQESASCACARRTIWSQGLGLWMPGIFTKHHVEVAHLRRQDIFGCS